MSLHFTNFECNLVFCNEESRFCGFLVSNLGLNYYDRIFWGILDLGGPAKHAMSQLRHNNVILVLVMW